MIDTSLPASYAELLQLLSDRLITFQNNFKNSTLKPYRCNADITNGLLTIATHIVESLQEIRDTHAQDLTAIFEDADQVRHHNEYVFDAGLNNFFMLIDRANNTGSVALRDLGLIIREFDDAGEYVDVKDAATIKKVYELHERLNKAIKKYRNTPSDAVHALEGLVERIGWYQKELVEAKSLPANVLSAFRGRVKQEEIVKESGYIELTLPKERSISARANVEFSLW